MQGNVHEAELTIGTHVEGCLRMSLWVRQGQAKRNGHLPSDSRTSTDSDTASAPKLSCPPCFCTPGQSRKLAEVATKAKWKRVAENVNCKFR